MIILYQFSPRWNLPNASPFCMKLETYLRMAKLPYQNKYVDDPRKSPKAKLPYIRDGEQTVADSSFIIHYLTGKYGDTLDDALTPEQLAQRTAMQRLIEEHLYWIILYARWIDKNFWPLTKTAFFNDLPKIMQLILPELFRKSVIKAVYYEGIGRHSKNEIYLLGEEDLHAISIALGSKPFFFGEKPTSIDASLYGFLANILEVPLETPLKTYAKSSPNLSAYCKRMQQLFNSLI